MRKLKLQVQMSVDGFVGRQDGGLDWMMWDWDDKIKNYVNQLHVPVDTILLGRKMTDGFISHWINVTTKPEDPDFEIAGKMVDTPKVVFTKTLKKSNWPNTIIATGELTKEINELKAKSGGDIIVYGGATFVTSLIRAGLIDDYHLFINPTAIGSGLTVFGGINDKMNMKLVESRTFDCGIVMQHYRPNNV